MTLTIMPKEYINICLAGTGTATIDWGDGTASETYTLTPYNEDDVSYLLVGEYYSHSYSVTTSCTISIIGENITSLHCYENQLTSLDVSKNTSLKILSCYRNQLTNLDLSKNRALEYLYCWENQLENLEVSKNTLLKELNCCENQLTNLDVSNNTALMNLRCSNNQLTFLNVSNIVLESLAYDYDKSISLNVGKSTGLITWEIINNTLIISGNGEMPDYTYNPDYKYTNKVFSTPWFSYINSITAVIIEDGITSIGDYAFIMCKSLTSITIPNSVLWIGNHAFVWCENLTSITIPNSVESIGDMAFYRCENLKHIYSQRKTPPTIYNYTAYAAYVFSYVDKDTCILHVPVGSKNKYENADGWRDFFNIQEDIIKDTEFKTLPFEKIKEYLLERNTKSEIIDMSELSDVPF